MKAEKTTDTLIADTGDRASAFARAAHVKGSAYRCPYQGHLPFAPNCALAEVSADKALVRSSTQDVYSSRKQIADVLGIALTSRPQGEGRIPLVWHDMAIHYPEALDGLSRDAVLLWERGEHLLATYYIGGSVVLSLIGLAIGLWALVLIPLTATLAAFVWKLDHILM